MKKALTILLTVVMIAAALPFAAFAGRFTDVPDGKWYSEAIEFCAANGYMEGIAEGVFDRNGYVTRAMFAVILAGIDEVDLTSYENKTVFTDVAVGKWYTAAITWAAENDLTEGIGGGLFGYKNNITREQIVLLLYTYANYKGIDTSARTDISKFDDAARIHEWAYDALEWGVASELISGIGNDLLDPRGYCTRAQAAVLIRGFVLKVLSECEHEWVDATCTEPSYCSKCQLKNGAALGHTTDNGICSRCGAEIFATPHDKLVYYIDTKGADINGKKGFTVSNTADDTVFTACVYVVPGDNNVYLSTEAKDTATGTVNSINVVLPDSNGTHYTLEANIADAVMKGEFDATLLDGYGDFTVTEFSGNEEDYALALVTSNYLLAYTVKYADQLMTENADVSLSDYGFVMNGFSIVK